MASFPSVVIFSVAAIICLNQVQVVLSVQPLMRLYNNADETIADFKIETRRSSPSIVSYWEDLNSVSQFCVTGTWMTFSNTDYTNGGVGGLIYSSPNITCQGRTWPAVASYRRVGPVENIYHLSLTTYTGEGYRGNETMYLTEGNILVPFVSFAVTGNFPITMYKGENLTGQRLCIDAPQNGLGGGLRNVNLVDVAPEEIKSFRFGCAPGSDDKHYQLEINVNDRS